MTQSTTRHVLLYGAGGHALVCLETLRDDPSVVVVAAITDTGEGRADLGIGIRRADETLRNLTESENNTTFCVGIGANDKRQDISRYLTKSGQSLTVMVSSAAVVSGSARLGDGVQILPGAIVMAATELGDGVIVNTNASIDHDCVVGAYAHIAPGVAIAGDVKIGERTLVGVGARVLPGLTIGADVVIGGGAVVIDDIADGLTVVGNPARPVERRGAST